MAANIILLSGGPGLFQKGDVEHDGSWANYVTAPLLMTDTPATNKEFMDGHEVWWFVHRPSYDARWIDDLLRNKTETDRVKGLGATDYVDLLRKRAKERGWNLRFIHDAAKLWTLLATFKEPIEKFMYWGHARNDLWLTLSHSATTPTRPDVADVVKVSDIADAIKADPDLPNRFRGSTASRKHQFIGCNTTDFAREWSKQLKVHAQGVTGKVDFKGIHAGGGVPSFVDTADVHTFDATGTETGTGTKWGGGAPSRRPRVLIDPGHGGCDDVGRSSAFGGRGAQGTLEKEVTLDVARRVAARLGGDAQLTRTGDQNLPLHARAQQAARAGADVFVSIHADSGRADGQGGETWVHPEAGADSRALALGIQRSLDRLGGRYGGSGSTLEGRMAVLSPAMLGARASACLVEIDNLSSARGEQRLRDPGYRHAVGDAIAGAIRAHLERSR